MKNLTATICLTIAVLLGSVGVSWSGVDWDSVGNLSARDFCRVAYDPATGQWKSGGNSAQWGFEARQRGLNLDKCREPKDVRGGLLYLAQCPEGTVEDMSSGNCITDTTDKATPPAFSADYQKGLTAYESGGYATALREWTPLAK